MAANTIYSFFWREFCDWYVELAKIQLSEGGQRRDNTAAVLTRTMDSALRLLHPFMPFITEEIWQHLHRSSIMISAYPSVEAPWVDEGAERQMDSVMDIIKGIRSIRSELNISPGQEADAHLKVSDEGLIGLLKDHLVYVKRLAWVGNMVVGADVRRPEMSAILVIPEGEIYLPLQGVIDIEKEKDLLEKRLKVIHDEVNRIKNKLSNKDFIEKAPEEIVLKEQGKYKEMMEQKERIEASLSWLKR